jgi:hypothetical protein
MHWQDMESPFREQTWLTIAPLWQSVFAEASKLCSIKRLKEDSIGIAKSQNLNPNCKSLHAEIWFQHLEYSQLLV